MPLTLNPDANKPKLKAVDFNPFAGPKLLKAVPTTPSQIELWLSCIIGGDDANRSYNESVSLDLNGELNQCAMTEAMEHLIERHEILRSTFSSDGKTLCVHENFPLDLELIDISDLPPSEQNTYIYNIHQKDANKAFDLLNGPLFRSYLIKLSDESHILKLSAHHIVCDGWSFGILLENISKIYNSIVNKESLHLDPVIQFSDYAKETEGYSVTEESKITEEYWLNQFADEVPVVDVPTDKPRPITRTFKSTREDFTVSKELIEKVKHMGAASGASLVSTLIAAFETYLHLITRQDTIVLGIPAAGQNATGHYELVGHCVNLLPLKSNPKGELGFDEYLSQRKSQILDAYDHQQFTFGTLLQKLNIARDSSRIPLVPVIFNIDMGMDANVAFSGLTHSLSNNPRNFENFEIFLNITGTEQALTFEWSYNSLLFQPSTIRRMMGEFEGVLNEIVLDPKICIKDLPLRNNNSLAFELEAIKTDDTCDEIRSVVELIDEVATDDAEKIAVYFKNYTLSYEQLNHKSSQLAHYLKEQGLQKGDIIALTVDRSPEMIIGLLGIMKSGAAYLPIDPQLPNGRIEYMLENASVKYILASESNEGKLNTKSEIFLIEDILNELGSYPTTLPESGILATDLAYILYTSGSTEKPKGVQIEHHSLTNLLLSVKEKPGITAEDRLLAITTISFDIAATEIFLPLISGASIVLVDSDTAKDGRELLDLARALEITIMQATPTTWRMMLAAGWNSPLPIKIICTGEAFPKDLAEKLLDRGQEVWNGYGPTETTIWSSLKQMTQADTSVTIGKPILNTEIYILDELSSKVPAGTVGEIFIAGEGLARGYVNKPDATAEKFIPNPFSADGSRMYATGDLGYYLSNGEIVCLGRKDNQVKIRGHTIELGEIEYNLMAQAGIKDAVVIADGDNPENQNLLAYIVPDETDSSGWINRWDDLYTLGIKSEEDKPLEEQNLDIAIISQYNTETDIHEHGIEWTNEGLKRIRAIGAKKILELGTGGGHLLLQLAPEADRYIATDYSGVAINKLREKLSLQPEKWQHVSVHQAPADDFSAIPDRDLDLVFLHGVVQYFPTLEYVVKVITEATHAMKDGGCIHIGDAQSLSAISLHFASEQLSISGDKVKLDEFKKTVQYRIEKEEEISIDPGFFYFLPQILPNIKAVDVQVRGGDFLNEATKCHYDIWLYVGESTPTVVQNDISLQVDGAVSIADIETLIERNPGKVVQLTQIPNSRVSKDIAIRNLMTTFNDQTSLSELKDKISESKVNGINPSDLWSLGEKLGYQTHVRWANDGADGNIEVVFIPSDFKNVVPAPPSEIEIKSEEYYFLAKKESVDILKIPEHQLQVWRNALQDLLPEYMVPRKIVAINHMPLNANGKIDRKALPVEMGFDGQEDAENSFIGPRNMTEQTIADIWSKLLGLKSISITSNFFELGGHSLIAVRVMLSLEKATGIKLPISTLFENSTIEKLAKVVSSTH